MYSPATPASIAGVQDSKGLRARLMPNMARGLNSDFVGALIFSVMPLYLRVREPQFKNYCAMENSFYQLYDYKTAFSEGTESYVNESFYLKSSEEGSKERARDGDSFRKR
ncbi:hypothetical protein TNCV_2085061 [Trichonephila clavipes]|uniref:Uncharacterized protein n=1 Tax=Trichonephila clavipes TaxID=2585209 RepID=A0A8X6UWY4_TRICX|nr:hypothetical protein TNCV_2085061 [Trichonephila clavipes]